MQSTEIARYYWLDMWDALNRPEDRDEANAEIEQCVQRLTNGTQLIDEDGRAAFKTLINDAMARPDDQKHPLLIKENWRHCPLSGVDFFRWTTADGKLLDFVMRYAPDYEEAEEEVDKYEFSVHNVD